jgi:hypothetical protein
MQNSFDNVKLADNYQEFNYGDIITVKDAWNYKGDKMPHNYSVFTLQGYHKKNDSNKPYQEYKEAELKKYGSHEYCLIPEASVIMSNDYNREAFKPKIAGVVCMGDVVKIEDTFFKIVPGRVRLNIGLKDMLTNKVSVF